MMKKAQKKFLSPLPDLIACSRVGLFACVIYWFAVTIRNKWFDLFTSASKKVNHPVISIGGVRAGGTGKTPASILVASLLQKAGYTTAFLSRGYRRNSKELKIVGPCENVDWKEIGDEPAMIHNAIPESWMGIYADRVTAAVELQKKISQKTVFLLDDGFQHRKLRRNLDIVCLHENAFDDKLIPQGYLREPLGSLKRAHAAFLIGDPQKTTHLKLLLEKKYPILELFELLYKPRGYVHAKSKKHSEKLPFDSVTALCGIARPERFFNTLKQDGLTLQKEIVYPDHYQFRKDEIQSFHELYSHGLVTTEKDAIRLLDNKVASDGDFWYLKMELCFSSEDSLHRFNKLLNTIF
jgi:tetraacyldisaccharide 4'-kinase